jgi:hypothetical protein
VIPRSLLFVLPAEFKGENQGVYIQHVESMRWLLESAGGWTVSSIDLSGPDLEKAILASDVAIVHMLSHPLAEGVIRRRRAAGLPTVFEITDNFLDLGSWLPKRHALRSPLVRQRILYHAWLCDSVQVYASPLAALFETVNSRIGTFDPYVPLAEPKPRPVENPFMLGWAGTNSHAQDLARIAPAIVDFCGRHPDCVFAFMGDRTVFDACFGSIAAEQTRVSAFGPYEDYLEFVRALDAGLVPLGHDGFNNARTDTKFATFAACGVAALLEAHPVHEPHAGRALTFDSPGDLTAKLEWLHEDRARAQALGRRARDWAGRERNAARLSAQRIDFYESLLAHRRAGGGAAPAECDCDIAAAVELSPLAQLRRSHRSWESRIDYFRAMLRQQPYDYVALRSVIAHIEAHSAEAAELDLLYQRLCLLAPEAVPRHRRPAHLQAFLPA